MENQTQTWRMVWRHGFVPQFTTAELVALRDACRSDDQRLIQGSTTTPPPLMCVQNWPCEAGCGLAYPHAATHGGFSTGHDGKPLTDENGKSVPTPDACPVGKAEERFAQLCFDADMRLGMPAACRFFLNWYDDCPRAEMRKELEAECTLALESRDSSCPTSPVTVGAA